LDVESRSHGEPRGGTGRRPYDIRLRRERAAETRERILAAGIELFREIRSWDWRELTFRAVARRAGVSERTVYRNFPTEQELRAAIGRRVEDEAGVRYEDLQLETVPEVAERVLALLPAYSAASPVHEHDVRRRDAFRRAVTLSSKGWPARQRELAAVALDVVWSVPVYERMLRVWGLDAADAKQVMTWLNALVVESIRDGRRPTTRPTRVRPTTPPASHAPPTTRSGP